MGINARYSLLEDRIELFLSNKEQKSYALWFNRSLWLYLIFLIQPFIKKHQSDDSINELKKPKKSSKNIKQEQAASSLVKSIKCKPLKDGMTIIFIPVEGELVSLKLNSKDLESLNSMLLDLAEKIGWDPFPALKRLKDNQNAKKVISNIMNKSKYN